MSYVEDMAWMFMGSLSFNQPLNNWDVSNVTNMWYMFLNATSFNQPLNKWNVSNDVMAGASPALLSIKWKFLSTEVGRTRLAMDLRMPVGILTMLRARLSIAKQNGFPQNHASGL